MMQAVHEGRVDVVVVWRFDRFARSLQHLATALEGFRTRNVAFVSHHEAIDTQTPMGEAMFHIIAAMAQLELALIKERVEAGVDRAREKGTRLGRPPDHVLDLNTISELLRAGTSLRGIARAMGAPLTSVRRASLQIGTGVVRISPDPSTG